MCVNDFPCKVQAASSLFYTMALALLNRCYPVKTITVFSHDPAWHGCGLKSKLRWKKRLVQKGRVDEASALAKQIGMTIENRNKTWLHTRDGETISGMQPGCHLRYGSLPGKHKRLQLSTASVPKHLIATMHQSTLIQTTLPLVASSQPSLQSKSISVCGKYSACSIIWDLLPLASTHFQHGFSNLALLPYLNQLSACMNCP